MKTEINTFKKIPFENLGQTIEAVFTIYKKTAITNGLFLLLMILVFSIIAGVFFSLYFNAEDMRELAKNFQPENFTTNQLLLFVGAVIVVNILTIPFIAGLLKVNQEADTTGEANFSTIFSVVNSPIYFKLVIAITLSTLISCILSYAYLLFDFGNSLKVLCSILAYVFALLNYFTIALITFKNIGFIEAISLSFKATINNVIFVVIVAILGFIAAVAGIFALCIGIFFTLPIIYSVQYVLYKAIFENDTLEA